MTEPTPGNIYHPIQLPDSLIKCIGPLDGVLWTVGEKSTELEMFIATNEFPKPHYLLYERKVENYMYSEHDYFLVHLITHSSGFNNAKIEQRHIIKSQIGLSNSFVTRDLFLIHHQNINLAKCFGILDLDILKADFKEI